VRSIHPQRFADPNALPTKHDGYRLGMRRISVDKPIRLVVRKIFYPLV
jgi:hypothetical protein